jgi:hypothetical protein
MVLILSKWLDLVVHRGGAKLIVLIAFILVVDPITYHCLSSAVQTAIIRFHCLGFNVMCFKGVIYFIEWLSKGTSLTDFILTRIGEKGACIIHSKTSSRCFDIPWVEWMLVTHPVSLGLPWGIPWRTVGKLLAVIQVGLNTYEKSWFSLLCSRRLLGRNSCAPLLLGEGVHRMDLKFLFSNSWSSGWWILLRCSIW